MLDNRQKTRAIFACVAVTLLLGFGAAAETDMAPAVFISPTKMSEAHRDMISHSGVVLIQTVADARQDLSERDYIRAKREIRKGRRLCHQIANASPSIQLRNSLLVAVEALGTDPDKKKVAEQLAPIYSHLDAYEQVADATMVRASLKRAAGHVEGGELEVAALELEKAMETIEFFEIDLPIDRAYEMINLATDDLERSDAVMADSRLRKMQKSLKIFAQIASIEVDEAELTDVAAPPPAQ